MEISIKWTKEELKLLHEALNLAVIHTDNDAREQEYNVLMKKVEMVRVLSS